MNLKIPEPFPVPDEMKQYPNWVVWGPGKSIIDKAPVSPVTGYGASPIDANTWGSYQQACDYSIRYGFSGIGFMLSRYDPYTFIDLDHTDNPEIIAQQEAIFKNFYSYAEISPSGRGLHIIVKGLVPRGRKRNKIEIYSQKRFMTMTGKAYRNVPIISCQEELIKLYSALGGTHKEEAIIEDRGEEIYSDEDVYDMAASAENGQKFVDLWEGNWHEYYPNNVDPNDPKKGASEADYALIDILAFYTDSKTQIVRMFHDSELGKREKAHRQDYLDWMLDNCFDNKLPLVDLSFLQSEVAYEIAQVNNETENPNVKKEKEKEVYTYPPGLVGDIAKYVYAQAPRPVREIALSAALGLMSGIVGKAYNVSGTGLNQYYLLLAETGRGKEAMASGCNSLMNEVKKLTPAAKDFMGPGEIKSSEALIRYLDEFSNSFVSIMGEFGFVLKQMTMPSAPTHLVGIRRLLLDLYNKSGEGQTVRPSIYSDKSKNTREIEAPAVTLLGESTPSKFYEVLDETMIAEGWLPRWLVIEYRGKRVKKNYAHKDVTPSYELVNSVANLCANSLQLNNQKKVIDVSFTPEGNRVQARYNDFCDEQINSTQASIRAELWNRAHLKALKLAALVAVGINPIEPVICENCMHWAINIVNKDCINIIQRFDAGEIGGTSDENRQINKVLELITFFITSSWSDLSRTTKSTEKCWLYHGEKIVPYSFIQRKCVGLKMFKDDRLGATNAIKKTLKTLVEMDEIALVSVADRKRKFNSTTNCYVVKNIALFKDAKRKGFSKR